MPRPALVLVALAAAEGLRLPVVRPGALRVRAPRMRSPPPPPPVEVALFPSPKLSPGEVVVAAAAALQVGDEQRCWRFASPANRRTTGTLRRAFRPYYRRPAYSELEAYAPLLGCCRFELVGALSIGETRHTCRVRVWPAGGERECGGGSMPRMPLDLVWTLARQPTTRPACYEWDPLQAGIVAGPPGEGCWMVESVRRDERWGDGPAPAAGAPSGGGSARTAARGRRVVQLAAGPRLGAY